MNNPQLDLLVRDQQRAEAVAARLPMNLFKGTWAAVGLLRGHPLIAALPFAPAAIRWHNRKLQQHEQRTGSVRPLKFLLACGLIIAVLKGVALVATALLG